MNVCEKNAEIDPLEAALVAALEAATAAGQWDTVRMVAEAIAAMREPGPVLRDDGSPKTIGDNVGAATSASKRSA